MAKSLDEIHQSFVANLERAMQISELYNLVVDAAESGIKSLGPIRSKFGGNAGRNQIDSLSRLKDSPKVKEILPIVNGQQVVLLVSSFEIYLKQLVKHIGNNHIGIITWPDKASGKIDLAILSGGNVTIGDLILAILEQHNISFQDLQAIKRFFREYIGLVIDVGEEYEGDIILATAIRHLMVHSGGMADDKFIKQIRNLDENVRRHYELNKVITLDEDDVVGFRDSLLNFSIVLRAELDKRIVEI